MFVRIMTVSSVVNNGSIMKVGAICRLSDGDVCLDVYSKGNGIQRNRQIASAARNRQSSGGGYTDASFEQTESMALCCACLSFSSSVFLGLFPRPWIPQIDETSNRLLCRQRASRADDCHRVLASPLVQNGLLFRSFEMSRQRAY